MILLYLLCYTLLLDNIHTDTEIHGNLFGRGVCAIHRVAKEEVLVRKMIVFNEHTNKLCWNLPPWCKEPTERKLYQFIYSKASINREHLTLKCCPGFKRSMVENSTECVPMCSSLCLPKKCAGVNVCLRCLKGFSGPTCNETIHTTSACVCPSENFICNHTTLKCKCLEGFEGPECQRIIRAQLILNDKKSCVFYSVRVGVLLSLLGVSLALLIFVLKKRICGIFYERFSDETISVEYTPVV